MARPFEALRGLPADDYRAEIVRERIQFCRERGVGGPRYWRRFRLLNLKMSHDAFLCTVNEALRLREAVTAGGGEEL